MEDLIKRYINNQINKSLKLKQDLFKSNEIKETIQIVSNIIINAYKNSNKTSIVGNGDNAADAQHIASKFISRFYFDRPGLASLALTTDTSN